MQNINIINIIKKMTEKKIFTYKNVKDIVLFLILTISITISSMILSGCKEDKKANSNQIIFATSSMYPPFEFHEKDELKGFDIDIAKAIARELNKEAIFEDMQFASILISIQNDRVDAGIATITVTEERKKNFDFSTPYYFETMAAVFKKSDSIQNANNLNGKKVVCQLGTTMEMWLKEQNFTSGQIITMDSPNQAIEAIKSGQADVAFLDEAQSLAFIEQNLELTYKAIVQSENGYGIAVKKGSNLLGSINSALNTLEKTGELQKIKEKWLVIHNTNVME